jgi:hypothetical protein
MWLWGLESSGFGVNEREFRPPPSFRRGRGAFCCGQQGRTFPLIVFSCCFWSPQAEKRKDRGYQDCCVVVERGKSPYTPEANLSSLAPPSQYNKDSDFDIQVIMITQ